ncbi:hypothetical protein [Couchioplanes caeruleus]|uniref:Uncharacterized protein n=2 Tax=Couchioplanes caeruleus TaxID=56438 RepID=A0A1K0F900_9ACTN|nr:hypothetical protein [Couchioplanes caeruleus]OJF09333.1 hypothetical protein BG844_38190 [Couchioplanes caeruleus subsp. caeruleus]ROP27639.1 hypothetical protein EDD30_0325 [Couchioplanes caeruleus]
MNKGNSRHRRIGSAIALLLAMLGGLLMAPTVGEAASVTTVPAEEVYVEVAAVDAAPPTLTLRNLKRRAENALGRSVPASDLSITVDGGRGVPSYAMVHLIDGPSLDLTLDELTSGTWPSQVQIIIKVKCNDCQVTVNPPPPPPE